MPPKLLSFFAALFLLAAPSVSFAATDEEKAVTEGAERVMAEQLKTLYLGHTIVGDTPKGYKYRTPVQADGTIPANKRRGAGKLLISEKDEACMQFPELWDGKPMCWRVYEVGKGLYKTFKANGALSANVTFEPLK